MSHHNRETERSGATEKGRQLGEALATAFAPLRAQGFGNVDIKDLLTGARYRLKDLVMAGLDQRYARMRADGERYRDLTEAETDAIRKEVLAQNDLFSGQVLTEALRYQLAHGGVVVESALARVPEQGSSEYARFVDQMGVFGAALKAFMEHHSNADLEDILPAELQHQF